MMRIAPHVNGPAACVLLCAVILWGGVAYDLLRMPVQVYDALDEILEARQSPGVWTSFTGALTGSSYLRPLRIAETKLLFDVTRGDPIHVYRWFHAALLLAAFLFFALALRVRTRVDAAAALFALMVFSGLHTFVGTVKEAYPINHFLQVVVLCLAALTLGQGSPRPWRSTVAVGLLAAACLTLESGVLVWVVLVGARLVGWRGVSWRGIATASIVLAAYVAYRFGWMPIESMQAASGYGFERLEPGEIQERFGTRMPLFYGHNVIVSVASVLFSEPRGGVWIAIRSWGAGDVPPRIWINVVTSILTTALIAMVAVSRLRDWLRGRLDDTDRMVLLFGVVLVANAAASFAYAKDEIMSVAGAFYALAVYAAVRARLVARHHAIAACVVGLVLALAAAGWAVRTIGVHHALRTQAFNHRNDWASVAEWLERRGQWPADAEDQALVRSMQSEALAMPVTNPWFMPRWAERVFDADY